MITTSGPLVVAFLVAAAGLWTSWCVAARLLDRARAAERATATAVVWVWLSTALFTALSAASAFNRTAALVSWIAAAVAAHLLARGRDPRRLLVRTLGDLWQLLPGLVRRPAGWLLLAGALVVIAHAVRGLIAPSLAWDDLTYHLFRAARWLQAGGFAVEPAPNAWGYSEYFPPTGDILWAWAMLPVHDDSLLVFANLFVYATIAVAVYAAARRSTADPARAALAAGAIVLTPSIIHYLPSAYVDSLTVALFAASVVFCARAMAQRTAGDLVLLAASLGLAVGVKISNLAFVAPGLAVIVLTLFGGGFSVRTRLALGLACAGALLVSAPFFARAWRDTGSPSYPVPVDVGGVTILAGNFWQQQIFAGPVDGTDDSSSHLLAELFVPARAAFDKDGQFLNPGPGALLLVIGAITGIMAALRSRPGRGTAAYMLAAALLVIFSALQPSAINLRATVLGSSFGRFLGVPLVAAAIWTAAARGPLPRALLPAALVVNCVLAIPLGWSSTDLAALKASAAWLLLVVATGTVAIAVLARAGYVLAGAIAAIGTLAVCAMAVSPARRAVRYDYYRDAAGGSAFTVNRDVSMIARAWPLWRHMDQDRPLQIAVAAGWPGMSPMGPRYPLLGARLQNRVTYVPITGDGSVADHPGSFARPDQGDFKAWLGRLSARQIDYLVILTPAIEGVWARDHADIFLPDDVGELEAYRIDHARAAAYLR